MKLVHIEISPATERCTGCGRIIVPAILKHPEDEICASCTSMGFFLKHEDMQEAWVDHTLPQIQERFEKSGLPNFSKRQAYWQRFLDKLLHVDKSISQYQYNHWDPPAECINPAPAGKYPGVKTTVLRPQDVGVAPAARKATKREPYADVFGKLKKKYAKEWRKERMMKKG